MVSPWQHAQIEEQRSEVFARVRRVFRWTVAGSLAAVAVIVGVVSHEIPGRAAGATPPPNGVVTPATTPSGSTGSGPANTGGSTGAGPTNTGAGAVPTPVPVPTQPAPVAVSGGTGW